MACHIVPHSPSPIHIHDARKILEGAVYQPRPIPIVIRWMRIRSYTVVRHIRLSLGFSVSTPF